MSDCTKWACGWGVPVEVPPASDASDCANATLSPREVANQTPIERLINADPIERLTLLHPQGLTGVHCRWITDHKHTPWAIVRGSKVLPVKEYREFREFGQTTDPEFKQGRLLALMTPNNQARYFTADAGPAESLFLDIDGDSACFFEGPYPDERQTRQIYPDGHINYYKGECDKERRVRSVYPDGTICQYKGPRTQERLVRKIRPNCIIDYAQINGMEKAIRHTTGDGDTITNFRMDGKHHGGRIVYIAKVQSGTREVYEGERNKERLVKRYQREPSPHIRYFKGSRKNERMVRTDWLRKDADLSCFEFQMLKVSDPPPFLCRRDFFEGPSHSERIVKGEEWREGVMTVEKHYKGSPREPRLVRKYDHQTKETVYFTGKFGEEVPYKAEDHEGNVVFFDPDGNIIDQERTLVELGLAKTRNKHRPKRAPTRASVDAEAARRAAVRKRWRSAAWRALRQHRADAEATRANAEAAARQAAVREQCDAAKAARAERPYTAAGPSHREGAPTWVAGDAPDARDEAKRAAEKDASRAAAAEAKAARRAVIARSVREYLEQARLLRVAEAIGGSK